MQSNKNFADYNTVFKKTVIPITHKGHNHYDANNINCVNNLDNIEPEVIVIDSASRNWDKEDNNNYTIPLGTDFHYVHSIELMDSHIPATGYIINNNNNIIHFQENNGYVINAFIEIGNYSIKSLLKNIEFSMNNSSQHHYVYECNVNPNTQKVTISCDHTFNLVLNDGIEVVGDRSTMEVLQINPLTNKKELIRTETSNSRNKYTNKSIGKILGFKPINLSGSKQYTGQMIYELQPYKYLAIFVNTENSDDFRKITAPSPDNGANGAFAIVHLKEDHYNHTNDNSHFIKTFNPPIHFNKIRIQYRTIDGNLYDFNGPDNTLVFEVKKAFGREIIKDVHNLS